MKIEEILNENNMTILNTVDETISDLPNGFS